MKRKLRNIALVLSVLLIVTTVVTILLSPYHKHGTCDYRTVEFSIEIDAPADEVFAYLGNSKNAEEWSVYVDHITPLNSDEYPDGMVGAERKCFQNANEEGINWDEMVVETVQNEKRRLTVYNLHGFSVQANGLETEQIYEAITPNKSRLTFTVFFGDHNPSTMESLKMYYASFKMHTIFKGNLEKIKALVEKA